jgi:hypothetical protein
MVKPAQYGLLRQKRMRNPAQIPRGAPGDTAFSLVQSFGLVRNVPLGLKALLVRKPPVA